MRGQDTRQVAGRQPPRTVGFGREGALSFLSALPGLRPAAAGEERSDETDVGWIRWLCVNPRYQRELLRMPDGLHGQINVQVWPVEVVGGRPLHVRDGTDCGVAEPGKVSERYK